MEDITAMGVNNVVDSAMEEAILALRDQNYCCSQILAKLILDIQGKENPDLIRSLEGLCYGIGRAGDVCGIMTGGVCVLSYLLGKKDGEAEQPVGTQVVIDEFVTWFENITEKQGASIMCADIVGDGTDREADRSYCSLLLAQAWIRILGILTNHRISYAAT